MEDGGPVLMDLLWSDPTTNDAVQVKYGVSSIHLWSCKDRYLSRTTYIWLFPSCMLLGVNQPARSSVVLAAEVL
jgi:hypothetical protein